MATVYSGEVSLGYNVVRVKCDYSGTSATLTVQFRRASGSWTDRWRDLSATLDFNNQSKPAAYDYSGTATTAWIDLVTVSGYTIPTSGGTFNWAFNNPTAGAVLGCSGTITIPAQVTPPTGLAISNVIKGPDYLTATVSVTGWGGAGDATTRYRNLSVWAGPDSTYPRKTNRVYGNTMSSAITVDNNSSGALTSIEPNTKYWYYASAGNGTEGTTTGFTSFVTTPAVPVISVTSTTDTTATVSYSLAADGGFYDKTLKYSIDGGTTWVDVDTFTGGAAQTGTFTISGLSYSTTYTLKTRVQNTSGDYTSGADVTFTTTFTPRFYGSVNDQTEKAEKFYGPVLQNVMTGVTGVITTQKNVSAFDGDTFWSVYGSSLNAQDVDYVVASYNIRHDDWGIQMHYTSSPYQDLGTNLSTQDVEAAGFTLNAMLDDGYDTITLTPVYTQMTATKEVVKIYGSVNGLTKRFF